jgi:hypothetical protein
MSHQIIRVHLASGTRITIAARDYLAVAMDHEETLNIHAVGYSFRVEVAA